MISTDSERAREREYHSVLPRRYGFGVGAGVYSSLCPAVAAPLRFRMHRASRHPLPQPTARERVLVPLPRVRGPQKGRALHPQPSAPSSPTRVRGYAVRAYSCTRHSRYGCTERTRAQSSAGINCVHIIQHCFAVPLHCIGDRTPQPRVIPTLHSVIREKHAATRADHLIPNS